MLADLRYALRSFRRAPGFTALVIATLAVGIGANTAVFSVVHAVLLRPFSYPDVDSLLRIRAGTSHPDLTDIARRATTISGVEGYRPQLFDYTTGTDAMRLDGMLVTGGLLQLFGAAPAAGRLIDPGDDVAGAGHVVLLSAPFWRSYFAADPSVVGRAIVLSGQTYTVVGVLADRFEFPAAHADVVAAFLPHAGRGGREATSRGAHTLRAFVRLKPGGTRAAAQQELTSLSVALEREYPETNQNVRIVLQEMRDSVAGTLREPLLILLATVAFVLLIACVNVANLLIARGAERRGELAVRAAIGATRARIMRQVLVESLVLAAAGGLAGIAIAWWLTRTIVALAPEGIPRLATASVDLPVLVFALAVSLFTGLLFGMLPALSSASASIAAAARAGSRASRDGQRLRSLLLVSEVALALVLLVGAGLLLRSFSSLIAQRPGFDATRLLTGSVTLNGDRYASITNRALFWEAFEERMRSIPGVGDVALTTDLPIGGQPLYHNLAFEGRSMAPGTEPEVYYRGVNPAYFRAMGIPLVKGRFFTAADRGGTPLVAIVNEAFAREYYPGEEVLGRRLRWASGDGTWITIVGVVADVRGLSLDQGEVPAVHAPFAQDANPWRRWMDVAIRTDGDAAALAPILRREILAVDRRVPVARVRTMEAVLAASVAGRRFNLLLLGSFAAVALLLAVAGIYGVMSYLVLQRTREIGVRLALGATPREVVRLITVRGLSLACAGIAIGAGAAALLGRFLETMLFGITAADPATFAGATGVLLVSAAAACLIPASRAGRVDPLTALRSE
jgi:putative ABC transport system permease protein